MYEFDEMKIMKNEDISDQSSTYENKIPYYSSSSMKPKGYIVTE